MAASHWRIAVLAAWALAALLVLPVATAQLPTGPAPGSAHVEVKASTAEAVVGVDAVATVEITVINNGNPTGTPLDSERTVTLSVSDAPVGWNARVSPTEFHLGPGKSGKATLTITVTPQAVDTAAPLTVTAKMFARGVNQVPVAGPGADPESTAATVVQAKRTDSVTRDVLETVGPYIWVVLLGLVAAVVLALSILAANRRVAVRLSSAEAQQAIAPGTRTTFPLRVHNITKQPDTVFLRTAPLPEGWAAYLPTPQLDLEGGQQEEVSVVVISPKTATIGAQQSVDVTATSSLAPRRPAVMRFDATVEGGKKKS